MKIHNVKPFKEDIIVSKSQSTFEDASINEFREEMVNMPFSNTPEKDRIVLQAYMCIIHDIVDIDKIQQISSRSWELFLKLLGLALKGTHKLIIKNVKYNCKDFRG